MSNKPATVPRLKSGNDTSSAKYLSELYAEAQNGLRKVVALGLACFEIKEELKHGQFQTWLMANCPNVSLRSLKAYMQLTKNVLAFCGFKTLGAYFKRAEALPFSHGGEFLLLPDAKVPEAAKELREKICSVIDGKSQAQLFLEFKQSDDDEEGPKPRRGRLPGQGGATKEQRAKAAEREEQERITALKLDMEDWAKWIDKYGDDKGIGKTRGSKEWNKLKEAVETLAGYMRRVDAAATKGAQQ